MRLLILSTLVMAASSYAGPDHDHQEHGCLKGAVEQFGRYVGDWKIADQQLSPDGSEWSAGPGARWTFECVGDGLAVQDYWQPANGGFGTNLRIYNASTDKWEIVWTAKALQGFTHITARQNAEGNLVMDVIAPQTPQPRRIIFFTPDEDGWDWTMQQSFDDGTTWTDVYRIRATPWEDG